MDIFLKDQSFSFLTPIYLSIKHGVPGKDETKISKQAGYQKLQPSYNENSMKTL